MRSGRLQRSGHELFKCMVCVRRIVYGQRVDDRLDKLIRRIVFRPRAAFLAIAAEERVVGGRLDQLSQ